jgi:hypothetical protein
MEKSDESASLAGSGKNQATEKPVRNFFGGKLTS